MNELTTIARDINEEHNKAITAARTAVGHARKAGELLIEAKSHVPHGEWAKWIK